MFPSRHSSLYPFVNNCAVAQEEGWGSHWGSPRWWQRLSPVRQNANGQVLKEPRLASLFSLKTKTLLAAIAGQQCTTALEVVCSPRVLSLELFKTGGPKCSGTFATSKGFQLTGRPSWHREGAHLPHTHQQLQGCPILKLAGRRLGFLFSSYFSFEQRQGGFHEICRPKKKTEKWRNPAICSGDPWWWEDVEKKHCSACMLSSSSLLLSPRLPPAQGELFLSREATWLNKSCGLSMCCAQQQSQPSLRLPGCKENQHVFLAPTLEH